MTHEQKITALIEAGEKARIVGDVYEYGQDIAEVTVGRDGEPEPAPLMLQVEPNFRGFVVKAANARDSIKLLAEIAEAAGEVRAAEKNMAREGNFEYAANADWGRKAYVLDTLLAKYTEASNG